MCSIFVCCCVALQCSIFVCCCVALCARYLYVAGYLYVAQYLCVAWYLCVAVLLYVLNICMLLCCSMCSIFVCCCVLLYVLDICVLPCCSECLIFVLLNVLDICVLLNMLNNFNYVLLNVLIMLHVALLFYVPIICHCKFGEKLGVVMLLDQAKRQLSSLHTSYKLLWIKVTISWNKTPAHLVRHFTKLHSGLPNIPQLTHGWGRLELIGC